VSVLDVSCSLLVEYLLWRTPVACHESTERTRSDAEALGSRPRIVPVRTRSLLCHTLSNPFALEVDNNKDHRGSSVAYQQRRGI
jgi:hypothetical protein